MASKLTKPNFSHEHRLGLVVYGGVSLAIYMNGICQEFYNAVRGRGIYKLIKALTDADIVVDIVSGTSAGGINGVLLSYALANSQGEKTDDHQKDRYEIKFEEFASVWKDSGDIQKLLFKKDDKYDKTSFFDGVGYYKSEIKRALEDRYKDLKEAAPKDDWFSEFEELDLFVTGTDTLGRIYQVFDNTGCVIDVKDHQTVFHLKYRGYGDGDNPFNPEKNPTITYEALAKLCQITSSFPVAFPPVTVSLQTQDDADEKLVEWGKLRKNRRLPKQPPVRVESSKNSSKNKEIDDDPGKGYRLHFVDGGVLDNRPFSYTIKEIYHRRAERPVFRKLFYIDPSPDRFLDNERYDQMRKPDIVQVVLDSLVGMPRYESINNDLEQIKEHNQKVRRYKFLVADIEEQLDKGQEDTENNDIYDQQKNIYLRSRLISLKDNILPLIFLESNDSQQFKTHDEEKQRNYVLDKVAQLLTKTLTNPERIDERLKFLKDLEKKVRYLDVEYVLRKYYFISDYIYRLLNKKYLYSWIKKKQLSQNDACEKKEDLDEIIKELTNLIKALNEHIKLLEVIKNKLYKFFVENKQIEDHFYKLLEQYKSKEKYFPEKFYHEMLWLHGKFLDIKLEFESESNFKSNLKKLNDDNLCSPKYQEIFEDLDKKKDDEKDSELKQLSNKLVLKQLILCAEEKIKELKTYPFRDPKKNKLLKYFNEFETFDVFLFPLDYLAGVSEKQEIETYRISPEDAKLGLSKSITEGKRLAHKLAGDSLNAFGGFLKKSWRANDILWGRLDGLNRIVEALITEDKIRSFSDFLQRQREEKNIDLETYLKCLLDDVLSIHSLSNEDEDKKYLNELRCKLEKILNRLSLPSKTEHNTEELSKEDFQNIAQELVEILVHLGHLFILNQELQETIEAAIKEQLSEKQEKQLDSNSSKVSRMKDYIIQFTQKPISSTFFKEKEKFEKFFRLNPTVMELAVIKLAKEFVDSMSLKKKEEFFLNDYKIGSEKLQSIPKSELKKIIPRFVRIFQDVLKTWWNRQPIHKELWSGLGFEIISYIVIIGLKLFIWRKIETYTPSDESDN